MYVDVNALLARVSEDFVDDTLPPGISFFRLVWEVWSSATLPAREVEGMI
jgi:hypothetical protein